MFFQYMLAWSANIERDVIPPGLSYLHHFGHSVWPMAKLSVQKADKWVHLVVETGKIKAQQNIVHHLDMKKKKGKITRDNKKSG